MNVLCDNRAQSPLTAINDSHDTGYNRDFGYNSRTPQYQPQPPPTAILAAITTISIKITAILDDINDLRDISRNTISAISA